MVFFHGFGCFLGSVGIISNVFGAQLRKSNDKYMVRSTLLHLLLSGGPPGSNPRNPEFLCFWKSNLKLLLQSSAVALVSENKILMKINSFTIVSIGPKDDSVH